MRPAREKTRNGHGSCSLRRTARESGDESGYFDAIDNAVPMGRIGAVREMANGILYLASDLAGYTTGAILSLDGGMAAGH